MISVIIPVYNCENTLRRCVESVLRQTETHLEILLIDDGSSDGSGAIADSYCSDARVRVFHKENGGLSSARNYGLDRATGAFVAFVDADDWIEPNTYETALRFCKDVCVFGYLKDFPDRIQLRSPTDVPETINGEDAVRRLIVDGTINHFAWNKLYRRALFDDIRFPQGAVFEDIRTTYKVLSKANRVALIPDVFYHYIQYEGSITHDPSARNLLDHWTAVYELYQKLGKTGGTFQEACIRKCANSIYQGWGSIWKADREMRHNRTDLIKEIVSFAKEHRRYIVYKSNCRMHVKVAVCFAAFGGRWSQLCVYLMQRTAKLLKPRHLYKRTDHTINSSLAENY